MSYREYLHIPLNGKSIGVIGETLSKLIKWEYWRLPPTLTSALVGLKWDLSALSTESFKFNLTGALHARYDLSSEGIDYHIGLSDGSKVNLEGQKPDRFAILPSLGAKFILGKTGNLSIEASYRRVFSENLQENSLNVGLNYRF